MSSNPARLMRRDQAKVTAKEGSRVFREALKVAENVEEGLRRTVCSLPLRTRLGIAWRILRRTW